MKLESLGYRSWFQIKDNIVKYIENYRSAKGHVLDGASILKNCGKKKFAENEIELDVGKWATNQNKYETKFDLSESVIRDPGKS